MCLMLYTSPVQMTVVMLQQVLRGRQRQMRHMVAMLVAAAAAAQLHLVFGRVWDNFFRKMWLKSEEKTPLN